jgi:hypothetical protein
MGWVSKAGTARRYYYRTTTRAGRKVKQYLGRGPLADLVWAMDELTRLELQRRRERQRAFKADLETLNDLARDVAERATLAFRLAMLLAGYRRHRQGEWRRPRASSPP